MIKKFWHEFYIVANLIVEENANISNQLAIQGL